MAFIKTTTNREGRTHVYLVEGYRSEGKVKQRIIKRFGLLDELEAKEPGILERLKAEAKAGTLVESTSLHVTYDLNAAINEPDKHYGWLLLDRLYRELNLSHYFRKNQPQKADYNLDTIFKLLVFQRILMPESKKSTFLSQNLLFGEWNLSLNSIYRSLDKLHEHRENVQHILHKEITRLTNRTASLVFYDVTNYYFETDIPDEAELDEDGNIVKEGLRRRGPSKEHRPKPIVQLGLFMDLNGIPISYRLFRGNQTDPITYIPAIKEVKKQFGIKRLIVVADKAMNSQRNIAEMLERQDGWIFSQKHRGMKGAPKDIQAKIMDNTGWEFNSTLTFAKKSYIRTRKIKTSSGTKEIQEKVLITWSKKYADRERIRRDSAVEYASNLLNPELLRATTKKGGKKYLDIKYLDHQTGEIKPFSPLVTLNMDKVDFDAQFDGINVIVTSELDLDDDKILSSYKELSAIEDCFRVTKSDLETRPVYVWKEEHIQAHFLTCFVALVLLKFLYYRINKEMSPTKIISALNSAKASRLKDDYYRLQQNEEMTKLNRLLGIEWDKGIVKYEVLKKYGNSCVYNKNI